MARPKLLLLDEPTSNLDMDTEALVLQTLQDWLEPDTTVIIVTHKVQLVSFVKRLMIVANGEIAIDGPTAEVIQRLQKPQTQQPARQAPAAAAQTVAKGPSTSGHITTKIGK